MVDPYYDPYGQALDDLAGNDGLNLVYACQAIGERAEAERIFDALVKEVHKRFYAYSAKLSYIEATHRDHA